jgi:hypothetical protein
MKPSEVLRKAAHVVMERGLAKWVRMDSRGRVCALGAMEFAATGGVTHLTGKNDPMWMKERYARPVWLSESSCGDALVAFNNNARRTAHDVASLLYSESEVVE